MSYTTEVGTHFSVFKWGNQAQKHEKTFLWHQDWKLSLLIFSQHRIQKNDIYRTEGKVTLMPDFKLFSPPFIQSTNIYCTLTMCKMWTWFLSLKHVSSSWIKFGLRIIHFPIPEPEFSLTIQIHTLPGYTRHLTSDSSINLAMPFQTEPAAPKLRQISTGNSPQRQWRRSRRNFSLGKGQDYNKQ